MLKTVCKDTNVSLKFIYNGHIDLNSIQFILNHFTTNVALRHFINKLFQLNQSINDIIQYKQYVQLRSSPERYKMLCKLL